MANFLSKTKAAELRAQLKYFENLTRNMASGRITPAEQVAINNLKMTICDLLCINAAADGCYMNDLRGAERTAYKF